MEFAKILKANPYHDEKGRFSTGDKARFVSTGGVFDKQRAKAGGNSKGGTAPEREFKDRSKDDEFATSQMKKLDALPSDQLKALKEYTSATYEAINGHLRMGTAVSDGVLNTMAKMDEAMKTATVGVDLIAYRGITAGPYVSKLYEMYSKGTLVGASLHDKGFSSVTVDSDKAKEWSPSVNLELKIKKEAKGFFVGHKKGDAERYTHYPNEREIIMNRGSTVRVTGARVEKPGRLIIEAEWQ